MDRPHAEKADYDIQGRHDGETDGEYLHVVPKTENPNPQPQQERVDGNERRHVSAKEEWASTAQAQILNFITHWHCICHLSD